MTYPDPRTQPSGDDQPVSYWPPQPSPASAPPAGYQQQPAYGPPPGYPMASPARPVSKRLAFWTSAPGILSMLVIAGAAIFLIAGISSRLEGPASKNFNITVTSCTGSGTGSLATANIGFTITNTSKTTRSATVHVEYRDADGSRLDTDTSLVRNLGAGETARQNESTILDGSPAGAIQCAITGVS